MDNSISRGVFDKLNNLFKMCSCEHSWSTLNPRHICNMVFCDDKHRLGCYRTFIPKLFCEEHGITFDSMIDFFGNRLMQSKNPYKMNSYFFNKYNNIDKSVQNEFDKSMTTCCHVCKNGLFRVFTIYYLINYWLNEIFPETANKYMTSFGVILDYMSVRQTTKMTSQVGDSLLLFYQKFYISSRKKTGKHPQESEWDVLFPTNVPHGIDGNFCPITEVSFESLFDPNKLPSMKKEHVVPSEKDVVDPAEAVDEDTKNKTVELSQIMGDDDNDDFAKNQQDRILQMNPEAFVKSSKHERKIRATSMHGNPVKNMNIVFILGIQSYNGMPRYLCVSIDGDLVGRIMMFNGGFNSLKVGQIVAVSHVDGQQPFDFTKTSGTTKLHQVGFNAALQKFIDTTMSPEPTNPLHLVYEFVKGFITSSDVYDCTVVSRKSLVAYNALEQFVKENHKTIETLERQGHWKYYLFSILSKSELKEREKRDAQMRQLLMNDDDESSSDEDDESSSDEDDESSSEEDDESSSEEDELRKKDCPFTFSEESGKDETSSVPSEEETQEDKVPLDPAEMIAKWRGVKQRVKGRGNRFAGCHKDNTKDTVAEDLSLRHQKSGDRREGKLKSRSFMFKNKMSRLDVIF